MGLLHYSHIEICEYLTKNLLGGMVGLLVIIMHSWHGEKKYHNAFKNVFQELSFFNFQFLGSVNTWMCYIYCLYLFSGDTGAPIEGDNFNMMKTITIAVCSAIAYLAIVIGLTVYCSLRMMRAKNLRKQRESEANMQGKKLIWVRLEATHWVVIHI